MVATISLTVGKPPKEEKDSDEDDGKDGLFQRQFRGVGAVIIPRLQRALLDKLLDAHLVFTARETGINEIGDKKLAVEIR